MTSSSSESPPIVLVVDDESDLADLYAEWLSGDYQVRTAYGGEEALEQYDEDVDVVLLDRRMPVLSGDEVLSEIRDRGGDCRVVMVTAVDPDFDILEMGFDEYVTKPVDREHLHAIVGRMLTRGDYDQQMRTYQRLVAQRATLQAEKTEAELAANDQFADLEQRIADLEAELDTTLGQFEDTDFEAAFRDIEEG